MLFEPYKIGNLPLKNRLVMLPTVTNLARDGFVSDREIAYYDRRSRDVSLVIVGASYVNKLGKFFVNQLGIDDDEKIAGLARLAQVIHKNGAKAGIQLAMHNPKYNPVDFSKEQVRGFVEDFARAAARAKEAGFDLVELHFAHGWFVNQFLSPDVNRRTDEYGGSFEGRTRFALEILQTVKAEVPDIAVLCRINVHLEDLASRKASNLRRCWNKAVPTASMFPPGWGPLRNTIYPPWALRTGLW